MTVNADGQNLPRAREGGNSKPEVTSPIIRLHQPDEEQSTGDSGDGPARGPKGVVIIIESDRITIKT